LLSLFVLLFHTLPPPPRRPPLFPYTTLFRSQNAQCHSLDSRNDPSQYSRFIINTEAIQLLKNGRKCAFAYDQSLERILYIFSDRDRKSTRLNSSHVSISYAVFCLNKKRNPQF